MDVKLLLIRRERMGCLLIVVLVLMPSLAYTAPTNNSGTTQDAQPMSQNEESVNASIPLLSQQKSLIKENQALINTIRTNYWRNRTYYSKLPPIVNLTGPQSASVLRKYGHFFTLNPPTRLDTYVYDGVEITSSTGSGGAVAAAAPAAAGPASAASSSTTTSSSSGTAVCPPTGVYEEITFVVNDYDEVLQMIHIGTWGQWILNETCLQASGNVPGTICVERERLIPATVINLETEEVTFEQIKVVSCAAFIE